MIDTLNKYLVTPHVTNSKGHYLFPTILWHLFKEDKKTNQHKSLWNMPIWWQDNSLVQSWAGWQITQAHTGWESGAWQGQGRWDAMGCLGIPCHLPQRMPSEKMTEGLMACTTHPDTFSTLLRHLAAAAGLLIFGILKCILCILVNYLLTGENTKYSKQKYAEKLILTVSLYFKLPENFDLL